MLKCTHDGPTPLEKCNRTTHLDDEPAQTGSKVNSSINIRITIHFPSDIVNSYYCTGDTVNNLFYCTPEQLCKQRHIMFKIIRVCRYINLLHKM